MATTEESAAGPKPPPISDAMNDECFASLYKKMTSFVTDYMSSYDPSHDMAHVQRVVSLSMKILHGEQGLHPDIGYNPTVVKLAALLHDVEDRKYSSNAALVAQVTGISESEVLKAEGTHQQQPCSIASYVLSAHGMDARLADKIQKIIYHVSYSKECKDPELVRNMVSQYPELGIVQDADRLDALGAIGIGRCFTFLGAQGKKFVGPDGKWEMENSIQHFGEKLEKLEGMMKTQTGRKMARERTARLKIFKGWWEEEMLESF
ncbi:hypothetical protein N7510_010703 [Penicillium lagena]|uniref:uncharacterized protein n=1 Tax=Penicillium lagena TaxID=94218 RepID=UPI002540115D|nr:uncharacterized protein N7510_010703 [Penicillium lagena]KAJ5601169.1 hypothetical protein N7510_010703 [Penicillium lagena]